MLRGAEYKNALEGAKKGDDRITLGIGESLKVINSLATHADPLPPKPQEKKTEHEQLIESWVP